jgi:transcriptional regulator with XRE-family HTH domain
LRARREQLGYTLRGFAQENGFDAGNLSKLERGEVPPPASVDGVERYAAALRLDRDSAEWRGLFDLASIERSEIPASFSATQRLLATLPATFRVRRKADDEEDAIDRFLAFLKREKGVVYIPSAVDVVVDEESGRNFDFELTPMEPSRAPMAVEIFRLVESEAHEQAETHRNRLWAALKEELLALGVRDVVVRTPHRTSVVPRDARKFARELAGRIRSLMAAAPEKKTYDLDEFEVVRFPRLGTVVCSSQSGAMALNPGATVAPLFSKNLHKKDRQLAIGGHDRIVLAVNWAIFVGRDDALQALATMDLSSLQNVDRVYFESNPDVFHLIYDRTVRDALSAMSHPPKEVESARLYEEWLRIRLYSGDRSAFDLVRRVSDNLGTIQWMRDRHTREAVAREAQSLTEAGSIEDGLWAARQLRDDPDPPLTNYPEDPDGTFNYHERVRRGEDVNSITTVRGTTCWLLQKLIAQGAVEDEVFAHVTALARDENLFVRQWATVPLIELANRKRARTDDTKDPKPDPIKALALEMLRANQSYPRVLTWVAHLFRRVLDLTPKEALAVLSTLAAHGVGEAHSDTAWLLLHFAEFRATDTALGAFDSTECKALAVRLSSNGSAELRRSLAFYLWKTVEADRSKYELLRPYIFALARGAFDDEVHHYLLAIGEKFLTADHSGELTAVIVEAIRKEAAYCAQCDMGVMNFFDALPSLRALSESGKWTDLVSTLEGVVTSGAKPRGSAAREVGRLLSAVPAELGERAGRLAPFFRDAS